MPLPPFSPAARSTLACWRCSATSSAPRQPRKGKVITDLFGHGPATRASPTCTTPAWSTGGASTRAASPTTPSCCHLAEYTPVLTRKCILDDVEDQRPRQRRCGPHPGSASWPAGWTLPIPPAVSGWQGRATRPRRQQVDRHGCWRWPAAPERRPLGRRPYGRRPRWRASSADRATATRRSRPGGGRCRTGRV
jgi:hypothetical protein